MTMRRLIDITSSLVEARSITREVWHATMTEFDIRHAWPMTHFGSQQAAFYRIAMKLKPVKQATYNAGPKNGQRSPKTPFFAYCVTLRFKNCLKIIDEGMEHTIDDILAAIDKALRIRGEEPLQAPKSGDLVAAALRDRGYDGLSYKNTQEDRGKMSYIITGQDNIASVVSEQRWEIEPGGWTSPQMFRNYAVAKRLDAPDREWSL